MLRGEGLANFCRVVAIYCTSRSFHKKVPFPFSIAPSLMLLKCKNNEFFLAKFSSCPLLVQKSHDPFVLIYTLVLASLDPFGLRCYENTEKMHTFHTKKLERVPEVHFRGQNTYFFDVF